jgi:hypothetical protein
MMRKLVRSSRTLGINRFGRTGLESPRFHSGSIGKGEAVEASAARARRNGHRATHCPRCDHRLSAGRCPSCHWEPRDYRPHRVGNILGDDLDDPREGLLGDMGDDDATDEGEE